MVFTIICSSFLALGYLQHLHKNMKIYCYIYIKHGPKIPHSLYPDQRIGIIDFYLGLMIDCFKVECNLNENCIIIGTHLALALLKYLKLGFECNLKSSWTCTCAPSYVNLFKGKNLNVSTLFGYTLLTYKLWFSHFCKVLVSSVATASTVTSGSIHQNIEKRLQSLFLYVGKGFS